MVCFRVRRVRQKFPRRDPWPEKETSTITPFTKCSCTMLLKSQPSFLALINTTSSPWICFACRSKLQWQYRKASSSSLPAKSAKHRKALPPQTTPEAQREGPSLQPLNHLIGADEPPKVGENPAKDPRPWSERRAAYWERSAHNERRRKMYGLPPN